MVQCRSHLFNYKESETFLPVKKKTRTAPEIPREFFAHNWPSRKNNYRPAEIPTKPGNMLRKQLLMFRNKFNKIIFLTLTSFGTFREFIKRGQQWSSRGFRPRLPPGVRFQYCHKPLYNTKRLVWYNVTKRFLKIYTSPGTTCSNDSRNKLFLPVPPSGYFIPYLNFHAANATVGKRKRLKTNTFSFRGGIYLV